MIELPVGFLKGWLHLHCIYRIIHYPVDKKTKYTTGYNCDLFCLFYVAKCNLGEIWIEPMHPS